MKPKPILASRLLVTLVFLTSLSCSTEAPPTTAWGLVVSTTWLADHLDDPDLVTLHIGSAESYGTGHIPGARQASLRRMIRVNEAGIRDEMPPIGDLSSSLAELGVGNSSRVVVYFSDAVAASATARYLLTLEYAGMTGRVAYLDGGLPKWVEEKRPVSSEAPVIEKTDIAINIAPDVIVDTDWLRDRLALPDIAIVDGRPAEGYSGVAGNWDRLGHIPGAGNIPFSSLLAADPPYVLRSRDELTDMFRDAGVTPGDTVVTYCGTGMWASLVYLTARYLGYKARLYDGSFQEWSAIEELPVEASPSPEG